MRLWRILFPQWTARNALCEFRRGLWRQTGCAKSHSSIGHGRLTGNTYITSWLLTYCRQSKQNAQVQLRSDNKKCDGGIQRLLIKRALQHTAGNSAAQIEQFQPRTTDRNEPHTPNGATLYARARSLMLFRRAAHSLATSLPYFPLATTWLILRPSSTTRST